VGHGACTFLRRFSCHTPMLLTVHAITLVVMCARYMLYWHLSSARARVSMCLQEQQ
jgi:hypothetical protein